LVRWCLKKRTNNKKRTNWGNRFEISAVITGGISGETPEKGEGKKPEGRQNTKDEKKIATDRGNVANLIEPDNNVELSERTHDKREALTVHAPSTFLLTVWWKSDMMWVARYMKKN